MSNMSDSHNHKTFRWYKYFILSFILKLAVEINSSNELLQK